MRLVVPEEADGERVDVLLARLAAVSRSQAGALASSGAVLVNGRPVRKSTRLAAGDVVEVGERAQDPVPPPPKVAIVLEDEDLLVVDKPAGLVVHPAPGVRGPTLVDALRAQGVRLAAAGEEDRPGIVHRLDRDVSGLLLLAKSDVAYGALALAMRRREIDRRYLALVRGVVEADRGKIEAPVGRHPKHRSRMSVRPEGRPATTWFEVLERFAAASLLEVRLETGRTHQIRTHLEAIGHPVFGDPVYGRDRPAHPPLDRPFLHARRLAFRHPTRGTEVVVTSPLPPELERVLDALR